MKANRLITGLIIIAIAVMIQNFAFSQSSDFDYGVRCLKLGNTYREAHNDLKASEYLDKGMNIVSHSENTWLGKYWVATANEFYGYMFRDKGEMDLAIKYLNNAHKIFSSLISQKDGSPQAIKEVQETLDILSGDIDEINHPPCELKKKEYCHKKAMAEAKEGCCKKAMAEAKEGCCKKAMAEAKEGCCKKAMDDKKECPKSKCQKSMTCNKIYKIEIKEDNENLEPVKGEQQGNVEKPALQSPYNFTANKGKTNTDVYYNLNEALANPDNVNVLDLSNQDLANFPTDINKLHNLTQLDLSNSMITNIPENTFSNMPNLRIINLSNNQLSKLPNDITKLNNLESIDIRNNIFSEQAILNLARKFPNTVIYINKE